MQKAPISAINPPPIHANIKEKSLVTGCAAKPTNKKIPENAYIQLFTRLQLVAKSIFYGEACSSVPLFKTQK